ncbi:hypothetical protein [Zobellia alginiliquefaciens]|uniref:hypothetical protein n=1 Tax=Zobellia alginiliquefaciens TaxID=3032586 RepID=UPI0023E3CF55|nr:hypothetical protein [Zobellia alginiliquefaciens]
MKRIKNIGIIVLLLTSMNVFAQSRNWTTETTKDGKSTVKYDLVKEEEGTHFYYIAQTTAKISLDELDTYFSNTANHKNFLERTPITKEIEKTSDNEWLGYYYFDAPWPMANSDIVIKFNRVKEDNKLVFSANAVSNTYKPEDVKRMSSYKVIYEFEKVDATTTKITYNADYVPVGSIPNFLIKTWFPEGPANIVRNIGSME